MSQKIIMVVLGFLIQRATREVVAEVTSKGLKYCREIIEKSENKIDDTILPVLNLLLDIVEEETKGEKVNA